MKRVYLLPNLVTAASMMSGMLALVYTIQGEHMTACHLILVSAALDFFDGKIARLTNASSSFGMNFDSLADLTAFGVAPAILAFHYLTTVHAVAESVASGAGALFALCGALRLARYNVQAAAGAEAPGFFTGMPTPAAGCAVVGSIFLIDLYPALAWLPAALPAVLVVLAYLMVSRARYFRLSEFALRRRKSFDMLVAAVLFGALVVVLRHEFRLLVALAAYGYLVAGLSAHLWLALRAVSGHDASADEPRADASRASLSSSDD